MRKQRGRQNLTFQLDDELYGLLRAQKGQGYCWTMAAFIRAALVRHLARMQRVQDWRARRKELERDQRIVRSLRKHR